MGANQAREGPGVQQMLENAAGRLRGGLWDQESVPALRVSVPGG
jgi:hypothetical protein